MPRLQEKAPKFWKFSEGGPPDPPSERGFNPLSHSPPATPLALPRRLCRLISKPSKLGPPPFQNPGSALGKSNCIRKLQTPKRHVLQIHSPAIIARAPCMVYTVDVRVANLQIKCSVLWWLLSVTWRTLCVAELHLKVVEKQAKVAENNKLRLLKN